MKNKEFTIDSQNTMDNIKSVFQCCIDCKACMKECHMLKEFTNSPKNLFEEILENGKIDILLPYSCNMCGSCTKVCPKSLKISSVFMDIRRRIAYKNGGRSPLKAHGVVHMHQKLSFSRFFNTVMKDEKTNSVKRVFMPGCSLCSYSPELVFKTYNYLKEKLPGTAMITQCCGKPTLLLGEEELFTKRYKRLERILTELEVDEIITACQSCYITVLQNSQNKKVRSLWTVLKDIGIPKEVENIGKSSELTFAIHDSCPTRDKGDIHDSVRWIIDSLGYKVEELKHSKENTKCCGVGGMAYPVNHELALKATYETAAQAKTDYMVTYCASCREAMIRGNKKALHILDLIFGSCWERKSKIPQTSGPIKSWTNKCKFVIKK